MVRRSVDPIIYETIGLWVRSSVATRTPIIDALDCDINWKQTDYMGVSILMCNEEIILSALEDLNIGCGGTFHVVSFNTTDSLTYQLNKIVWKDKQLGCIFQIFGQLASWKTKGSQLAYVWAHCFFPKKLITRTSDMFNKYANVCQYRISDYIWRFVFEKDGKSMSSKSRFLLNCPFICTFIFALVVT